MSSEKMHDVDINEAFENILFAEEIAQNSGYEEGFQSGKTRLLNGFHLGYHRASVLAAQLGYFSGILEQYLREGENNSKKAVSLARELLEDISNFPARNDVHVDILTVMESIRFKYARFCSLAKISSSYPEIDRLEF